MNKKQEILDQFPEETFLFCDGMDDAIIGVSSNSLIVYSVHKCIEILMKDMTEFEAMEYFDYNIECAYMGEKTPIYVHDDIF